MAIAELAMQLQRSAKKVEADKFTQREYGILMLQSCASYRKSRAFCHKVVATRSSADFCHLKDRNKNKDGGENEAFSLNLTTSRIS